MIQMPAETDIYELALDLSPARRADLARRLLQSLEPPELDPAVDDEWALEIENRMAAIDQGESELTDWRAGVERIRASLRSRKPRA